MSGNDDSQSAIRTFFTATSRWSVTCSTSSMSASEALAMRDAILAHQWEKASDKGERASEPTR